MVKPEATIGGQCPDCQEAELKGIVTAGSREDDYEYAGVYCPNCGFEEVDRPYIPRPRIG